MFGFVFGAVCLMGMFAFAKRRRHFGHHCGGRRFGRWRHEGWDRDPHWHDRDPGWRRRSRGVERMSDWLASRLDATPEQYRVIRNEMEQFTDQTRSFRDELQLSRQDIVKAMQGQAFDEEVMGESFARQDDRIREIRQHLVGTLARIHDVLDVQQRDRLVDLANHFGGRRAWR